MNDHPSPAALDPVAIREWVPCCWLGQLATGQYWDTKIFNQPIRVKRNAATHATKAGQNEYQVTQQLHDGQNRNLPVQVRFGTVFTTLGDPEHCRPLPPISEFDEPDRRLVWCGSVRANANPYRMVENFLDLAHLCFIHKDILGDPEQAEVPAYKTEHRKNANGVWDEIWAVDCTFYQPQANKAATTGQVTQYIYRVMSPFSVMLYKTVNGDPSRNDAICLFIQPVAEAQSVAYVPMAMIDEVSTDGDITEFQQSIFMQDRRILENQRPALLPLDPAFELPMRADASSLAYRRWLKGMNLQFGILEKHA